MLPLTYKFVLVVVESSCTKDLQSTHHFIVFYLPTNNFVLLLQPNMMKKTSISYSLVATILLVSGSSSSVDAYTTSHDLRQLSRNKRKIWNIPTTTSTAPPSSAQDLNMLKKNGVAEPDRKSGSWELSQAAAVHSMDTTFVPRRTAPSSGVAHGLLSPEIVARMDEQTVGGHSSKAVQHFLQTYRKQGPMSCLEMLSDPDVLPHLTAAMRDVVWKSLSHVSFYIYYTTCYLQPPYIAGTTIDIYDC